MLTSLLVSKYRYQGTTFIFLRRKKDRTKLRKLRAYSVSGTTNVAATSGRCIVSKQSGTDGNINIGKSAGAKA